MQRQGRCWHGHGAVVERLIEAGAAVDPADKFGWTPLCWAAAKGHEAMVGRLIEAGAAVDKVEKDASILLLACAEKRGWTSIVALLRGGLPQAVPAPEASGSGGDGTGTGSSAERGAGAIAAGAPMVAAVAPAAPAGGDCSSSGDDE